MIKLKRVLITGASKGLGYSLAEAYAGAGYFVIACARNIASVNLLRLKEANQDNVRLVTIDVAKTDSVEKAAAKIRLDVPSIDIIINNAAIHPDGSVLELEKMDVDDCLDTININTLGALRVAKAFLTLLENSSLKTLINITSEAGSIYNSKRVKEFDYCMSKTALNMQSKLLQNYLENKRVTVLAIHPGWMRTDMGGQNAKISSDEAANGIINIIENCSHGQKYPLYIDYKGIPLEY